MNHNTTSDLRSALQYKFYHMTNLANRSLAEIVTENNHAAAILEKYHLDYCCKGKRTLEHACAESAVPLEEVTNALLQSAEQRSYKIEKPFREMNADQLVEHILVYHHSYVKQSVPQLLHLLSKLFQKHRENFEWIEEGFQSFMLLQQELLQHMEKEERMLFPAIREIEKQGNPAIRNISGPITVMEDEHDEAGRLMERIRIITNNYTPAENACTTHRVALAALKDFEENLHEHVHIENNILFPLALELQYEMNQQ